MRALLITLASFTLAACGIHDHRPQHLAVAPPPAGLQDAYQVAGEFQLPFQDPIDVDGLENVVFLGKHIISGDEPNDEQSFARLQAWGVRSILSVDGKVPDEPMAKRFGMRYVHIPISYKGITETEIVHMSKTFRELEGPFYVHCFHGRHRGPAAAAIGRLILDGIAREQAIAEMRQYCSTSSKYPGLFATVAETGLPSPKQSADSSFGFDSAHRFDGLRAIMTSMARIKDRLEAAMDRNWKPDPAHPDIDALQDATQLYDALVASARFAIPDQGPDYDRWMQASTEGAASLLSALSKGRNTEDLANGAWDEEAVHAFESMEANCLNCHAAYRNR